MYSAVPPDTTTLALVNSGLSLTFSSSPTHIDRSLLVSTDGAARYNVENKKGDLRNNIQCLPGTVIAGGILVAAYRYLLDELQVMTTTTTMTIMIMMMMIMMH